MMCNEAAVLFSNRKKAVLLKWISPTLFLAILFFSGCDPNGNRYKAVTLPDSTGGLADTSLHGQPVKIKNILFFGNSITAGLGLDSASSFPYLIQQKIDSLKLPYKAINSGFSGETTAGGDTRIDVVLSTAFDIFVLELGGNDGLQKLPVSSMTQNLQTIIDKVRKKYPSCKIILAGMQVPANLGQAYASAFKAAFPQLAAKDSLYLIPFLLDGVGGIPALNQADGIHPNAQGEKIVADNVWKILHPLL
ncbi:MAG: arylesterase [Bacteroidota bacterium]|nr:arylesterase [Bacteroidota bacterium]